MKELFGNEFNKLLPCRSDNTYKGSFGILGAVVGSRTYQGAACYSVSAALHSGVGIAVAFIPEDIYIPFASKISGAVIEPLRSECGAVCDDGLLDKICSRRVNAILCGCGLSLGNGALSAVKQVLSTDLPVVLDGDGITLASLDISLIERDAPTVLTPHLGEFSRLCGCTVDDVINNREELLRDFSVKYNCITVLKDSFTLICDKNGDIYKLSRPCSALSKGGSGDVLAGFVASFMTQGICELDSAISAVTLHNACGRLCAEKFGSRYSQPDDYIKMVSYLKV